MHVDVLFLIQPWAIGNSSKGNVVVGFNQDTVHPVPSHANSRKAMLALWLLEHNHKSLKASLILKTRRLD